MTFAYGPASRKELVGVHPLVVRFAELTLEKSPVDIAVADGLRTIAEQREYVRTGVSKTLESMHLPQSDGLGRAVDLVPFIGGRKRWEWPPIYQIAAAANAAAHELQLGGKIRWGGCWEFIGTQQLVGAGPEVFEDMVEAYGARRRAAGKKPFTDGPHYELLL